MENLSSKTKFQLAKEKVENLKGFYSHLAIYFIVMLALIVFNLFTSDFFWVIFPLLGWGIGILGHASNVFEWNLIFSKSWEKRQIEKIMNEENNF